MTSAALSIGFRPFYFLAAAFAALAVPLWFAAHGGWLPLTPALPAFLWHAHEMVFGFAPAVIVGFLLTAVRNWTGRPTPSGAALAALALLWLAGRVAMLTGPGTAAALIDVAFLPVAAVVLAVPLARSRNARNAFVVPLILLLGGLAALHHARLLGTGLRRLADPGRHRRHGPGGAAADGHRRPRDPELLRQCRRRPHAPPLGGSGMGAPSPASG